MVNNCSREKPEARPDQIGWVFDDDSEGDGAIHFDNYFTARSQILRGSGALNLLGWWWRFRLSA